MPGDGVSLPTTLAQMGSVAKTQARGQQSSPQVTPFSEQKQEQDELGVQRVKETTESEKNHVCRQAEEKDKRKRRRLKRNRRKPDHPNGKNCGGTGGAEDPGDDRRGTESGTEELGSLIDLRV